MARPRVVVIHWNPDELADKVRVVEEAGGDVVASEAEDGARAGRRVRELAPDALAIWITRLPSHGRVTAAYVRSQPWGRKLPILLVDGDPAPLGAATMATVRAAVPDAVVVTTASLRMWLGKVADLKAKAAADPKTAPGPAA